MTNIAYKKLTNIEQIFKDLIWTPGIKAGELVLEGAAPFFALPVIKSIEEGTIEIIADWLFNQFVLLVDVAAIKLVNQEHQAAYDKASLQLKIVATESGVDSDDFKKMRDIARAALSRFTNIADGQ